LGGLRKRLEWNNIDSYRRKGSLLIQMLYLWYRGVEKENKIEIKFKNKGIRII